MTAIGMNRGGGTGSRSGRSANVDHITLATVMEAMHKISVKSKTGLVRLHRIVKRLRNERPGWNQWSRVSDLSKDVPVIRKFVDELITQNLAHSAGLDTYRPGPSISPLVRGERTYTEQEIEFMRMKQFSENPFICLSCYRDAKCLDALTAGTLTVENLLQMLQLKLEDPEPHKTCECPLNEEGAKICGGSGYIGTCPKSRQSKNQKMRIEQFRLLSAWMELKDLYAGQAEWAQCRRGEFGSPEVVGALSNAADAQIQIVQQTQTCRSCESRTCVGHHQQPQQHGAQAQTGRRKRFFICSECLRAARSKAQTPSGFSSREIVLMICDLLSKEEFEEQDVHCVCKNCLDNPESVVSVCRRRTRSSSSHSRKVNRNIELIANWVKERDEKQRTKPEVAVSRQRRHHTQQNVKRGKSMSRDRRRSRKSRRNR